MISLTINDQTISAEPGQTVMQAALAAEIYIPSLCYHPAIASSGACRICVVEIEGRRGLATSCTTAVAEGMVVRTETPEVQQKRKNLLWLMQSEHPVDVTPGTQFAKVLAHVGVSEFPAGHANSERPMAVVEGDPLYIRDPQRCILCERCVRICKDTRGVGAIGLIGRGIETTVSTPEDEPLTEAACRFCGACVEVCPTGALRDKTEFAAEEKTESLLPCSNTCPAGINISRYVRYIAEGRFQDAVEVIRQKAPLPLTLGCVCDHPCEAVCRRADVDEPVAIRLLKRYAAQVDDRGWQEKLLVKPETAKRVAIVGAGPAGLTAAWFARLQGHAVTIFESKDKAGGMLRYGIPRYRLPAEILDREIADIVSIGIELKCGESIESVEALKAQGFDAVFLGVGCQKGTTMGLTGEEDPRCCDGIELLRRIGNDEDVSLPGRVVVVGGGNVAMDVVRSALRLGADDVKLVYRRTRAEMPADPHEIHDAIEEGVDTHFLTNPTRILPTDDALEIECVKMELGAPDDSGRRRPVVIEGSEFLMEADWFVAAIGQAS
ncbi:MAG: FAD-dependent oxidoreductase, partial [Phycisphaerales bacterium]|nr:FAD-dependent oxidoreductase [Phycisphaerales bacterium]